MMKISVPGLFCEDHVFLCICKPYTLVTFENKRMLSRQDLQLKRQHCPHITVVSHTPTGTVVYSEMVTGARRTAVHVHKEVLPQFRPHGNVMARRRRHAWSFLL